ALHKETMAAAQQKLDAALKKYPGETALTDLSDNAKAWREAAGLGDVAKVSGRVNALMQDENFEPAIALLEHAIKAAPNDDFKALLGKATSGRDDLNRRAAAMSAEAEKLLKAGKADDALLLLEAQPQSFTRHAGFLAQLDKARSEQDRLNTIEVSVI